MYYMTRTNYFKVTNKKAFSELVNACATDDPYGATWTYYETDGEVRCSIKCEGYLLGLSDDYGEFADESEAYDAFIEWLQELLPDGEVAIIKSGGIYKGIYFIPGEVHIVTNKDCVREAFFSSGIDTARKLLNDPTREAEFA